MEVDLEQNLKSNDKQLWCETTAVNDNLHAPTPLGVSKESKTAGIKKKQAHLVLECHKVK